MLYQMTFLAELLRKAISKFMSSTTVDERTVQELVRDLQRSLLLADVNVELVQKISDNVRRRALEERVPPGISRKDQVIKILYEELVKLLGEEPARLDIPRERRYVLMMVGIQGFGKTTSIAKLAYYLKKNNYSVGVICADTYRPGACDQLAQLLSGLDIPVYRDDEEKDPINIVKKGVEKLGQEGIKVFLIDTAGRHRNQEKLMEEIRALGNAIKPDEVMLVIDAGIGQQAGVHAKAFHEAVPVGSIFLTKMDTSAKGGGALSAIAVTGARIKFLGTGEKIDEIELFNPSGYVGRLLGLGDLEGLLERFRLAELEMSKDRMEAILRGDFTVEQFVRQLKELRKAGPFSKLLSKLPLPNVPRIPDQALKDAEEKIKKWDAIICSMTPEERMDVHLLNSSRVRRIARGAGVSEKDVKELVKQYRMVKKFMKSAKRLPKKFLQYA